ncbi:extracellular solute-binding protein [Georgenia halophila]|uniref:Extracellular solute-binding protein n=1 Tax=Georgenia halophila TaxID=620889 RepID=A0ABP8LFH4_9MICO
MASLRRRRATAAVGLALSATTALTACGQGENPANSGGDAGGGDSEGGQVQLRFVWWGGTLRNEMTQEVIEVFEAKNPDIDILPQPGSWDGYWDKLATEVASGTAPDIIQMPDSYFNEYVGRGALLDLTDLALDHSNVPDAIWNTGVINDRLWGVPSGVNTHAIVANPAMFDAAGVEMPDDTTWTWDEYADIATELSESLSDDQVGSGTPGLDQNNLATWLRQNGAELFTEEGELGFDTADATGYFAFIKDLADRGAIPGAETISAEIGLGLEQSGMATGRHAMGFWASNQLAALSEAAGTELELLRLPTSNGNAEDGAFAISGGWYVAYEGTEHPEEVARFLDFMVNSQEVWNTILTERGAPPNTEIRQNLIDGGHLGDADARSIEFLNDLETVALEEPPAVPPVGAGAFQDILRRYTVQLLFERMTPEEAAEGLVSEANSAIE